MLPEVAEVPSLAVVHATSRIGPVGRRLQALSSTPANSATMLTSRRHRRRSPRVRVIRAVVALCIIAVAYYMRTRAGREISMAAADWSCTVTHVFDGDSFEASREGQLIEIRLFGVDCPEKDQPFADEARRHTSDMILGKTIRVDRVDTDRYGRTVADVYTADGAHLNAALLEAGYAWWYERYAPDRRAFEDLEAAAREAKRGLWADPDAVPPWEYRDRHRAGAANP